MGPLALVQSMLVGSLTLFGKIKVGWGGYIAVTKVLTPLAPMLAKSVE